MKITKNQIKALGPCQEGWEWYLKHKESDFLMLLLNVNSAEDAVDEYGNFQGDNWARWLFTNLMTKEQCVEVAVFSAILVLSIFEKQFPRDDRPRAAIQAAKNWLEDPSEENRRKAAKAAEADREAAGSAALSAGATTWSAWYAAWSAWYAAWSVWSVADAARYAAEAARYAAGDKKHLQEMIIREAVRILEKGKI